MYLYYQSDFLAEYAQQIAAVLQGKCEVGTDMTCSDIGEAEGLQLQDNLYLYLTFDGLVVHSFNFKPFNLKHFYQNFISRRRAGLNQEMLLQAINLKGSNSEPLSALDLTAGLGRDALLLALSGIKVTMIEDNPYLALILHFLCLEFAESAKNLQLVYMDNYDYLLEYREIYDIIYLDPMFNDGKQSLAKKDMQLIDLFIKESVKVSNSVPTNHFNLEQLFITAISHCRQKLVVKRDNKQSRLIAKPLPTYTKSGKTIRFDVYQCVHKNIAEKL